MTMNATVVHRHRRDCMVCGAELKYLSAEIQTECVFCKKPENTRTLCVQGHFVCDGCHAEKGLAVIQRICEETDETDMLVLLEQVRRHPSIPLHGPEHHAMVPAIILATYRNLGGELPANAIQTGIRRGVQVPGGHCGFAGVCGAAAGVGVAFGLILESSPLKKEQRSQLHRVVAGILNEIGKLPAARCCQRDSWTALREAARLSRTLLPIPLEAGHALVCKQHKANRECLGDLCPLFPDQ